MKIKFNYVPLGALVREWSYFSSKVWDIYLFPVCFWMSRHFSYAQITWPEMSAMTTTTSLSLTMAVESEHLPVVPEGMNVCTEQHYNFTSSYETLSAVSTLPCFVCSVALHYLIIMCRVRSTTHHLVVLLFSPIKFFVVFFF